MIHTLADYSNGSNINQKQSKQTKNIRIIKV